MTLDFKDIKVSFAELALLKPGGGRCFYCADAKALDNARQLTYAFARREKRVFKTETQANADGSYLITISRPARP